MFQAITKSFPTQARQGRKEYVQRVYINHIFNVFQIIAFSSKEPEAEDDLSPFNTRALVKQLSELGFSKEDCQMALKECDGQLVKSVKIPIIK